MKYRGTDEKRSRYGKEYDAEHVSYFFHNLFIFAFKIV
jgi:hypothetical protein